MSGNRDIIDSYRDAVLAECHRIVANADTPDWQREYATRKLLSHGITVEE